MLDKYKIITVTHKRINLKEIKDFVVHPAAEQSLEERLRELKEQFELEELMYVSTCNRVMYLFSAESVDLDEVFAARFLQAANPRLSNHTLERIEEVSYLLDGLDAIEHLYDVAASIDSLVIGERQILGQLREAYNQCREWGLTGDSIRILLQHAVQAAKGIYSNTRIGDKPVSIVSLAFQQMMRPHVSKDARVLMVGAGQTNQLVAKFLAKHEFTNVTVFNRTLSKAEQIAESLDGEAFPLSQIDSYRDGFDYLIVCTGSREPMITDARYARLLNGETDRKAVIDLAVPHNVARTVTEAFDMQYIEIEGLRNLAKENLAFREQEVTRAKEILHEYLLEFPSLYKQRQLEIAMREVPTAIKAVKSRAMNEVFRKELDQLDEPARELMERMLTYMEKKCIGIPMKAAREAIIH